MTPFLVFGLLGVFHSAVANMPPKITCLKSFSRVIPEKQTKVSVTWDESEIVAFDQEDGILTPNIDPLSPSNGDELAAGVYNVKYTVTDSGGRMDSCTFAITVTGADCPSLPNVQYGRSTCRQGAVYGETCSVVCDDGYEVMGENSITCQLDGTYTDKLPYCREVTEYKLICNSITSSTKDRFIPDIDQHFESLKNELISEGSLDSYQTIERARELCSDKNNSLHGSCVFLRRYDLFQLVKMDSNRNEIPYRSALLLHSEIAKFCKVPNFLNSFFEKFPDIVRFDHTTHQTEFENTFEMLNDTYTTEIRKEAFKICTEEEDKNACLLHDVFDLTDRSLIFISHLKEVGKWRDVHINSYFNALTFSSVLLKWNYLKLVDAIRPTENRDQQNVLSRILTSISTYVDDGDDEKMRIVMSLFPEVMTDKICNNGKMCLFWRVVDQTRVYLQSRRPAAADGVKVRVLDSSLDKRKFLEQKQMERLIQLMADNENNLIAVAQDLKSEFKKALSERFSELKTYFKNVNSFNAAKSKADLVVIQQIKDLTGTAQTTGVSVDSDMTNILITMLITAGIEVHGQGAKLALVIAENCNPLKALTDASPSSIYEAASALAHAVAKLAKAGRLVASITTLRDTGIKIRKGFAKNDAFFAKMTIIMNSLSDGKLKSESFKKAKDEFIKAYNDFTPALKRYELTEMGSLLTNVINEACGLIESTESLAAAIPAGIIGGTGLCWTTKVEIDKLMTMYESIFDKQFELVEVLASNVQAQVALEAADGIVSDYNKVARAPSESDDVLQKLQQVAGMSYVSYRLMVIQVIRLFCDELEYKNGGIRPPVCKDSGTDISLLLSYRLQDCTRKLEFASVPGRKRGRKDTAFMDISKLYKGEDTYFKIPSSKWLYNAGWITAGDMDSVIYLMGMEIYLPSEVVYRRDVRVQVYVEGRNELRPGGTRYRIENSKPMIFEYKLGDGINCRQAKMFDNPYNTCPTNKIADICPQTEYSCFLEVGDRGLFPSIYSWFKIRVNGHEKSVVPNESTRLDLRIGIRTCTFIPNAKRQGFSKDFSMQARNTVPTQCCSDGQYWSSHKNACFDCPVNSTVAMKGYYCQRDN